MTTPRMHARVSPASVASLATLVGTLALGACAPRAMRPLQESPLPAAAPAVRFDNDARQFVHVYLVGERREWLLGRVEPGAKATLRVPRAALAEEPGLVRLAVLSGQPVTLRAASDARAVVTLAQPASAIVAQRWAYAQPTALGQLTALRVGGPAGR